ncbi:MAG: hypothetical protein Q9160_001144 [Pyrenula sp. 1 TL-2023]
MLTSGQTIDITPWAAQQPNYVPRVHDRYGMVLQDLESPLFQSSLEVDRDRGKRYFMLLRALHLKPSLPGEIKHMILEFFRQEKPIDELTDAPPSLTHDPQTIEVHALFPSTDLVNISDRLGRAIRSRYPEMHVKIYAWESNFSAARRDFLRVWDRFANNNVEHLVIEACFLDGISAKNCDSLIFAKWCSQYPVAVRKITLDQAVELWKQIYDPRVRYHQASLSLPTKLPTLNRFTFREIVSFHMFGILGKMLRMATALYYRAGGRLGRKYAVFIDRDTFENGDVILSSYGEYHTKWQSYGDDMTHEEKVNRYKQGVTTVRMKLNRTLYHTMCGLTNSHEDFDQAPFLGDFLHVVSWDEVFGRAGRKTQWRRFTSFEERRWAYENRLPRS